MFLLPFLVIEAKTSGTTVTFVIVEGWIITVASVGDSRCVLESAEGDIYYLSADHRLETNEEEVYGGTSRVYTVLEEITENVFLNLHEVQKNLQFWQSRAEGSDAQRMYFMILERGPLAFIDDTIKLIKNSVTEGAPMQHLSISASVHISERISILNRLRCSLAAFLAQIDIVYDYDREDND